MQKLLKSISVETLLLPFFSMKVKAGFPSPALDYMEERIDLNDLYIKHPISTFIVEVEGDSMIGACIPPKAKLIVDKSLTPKNGDIVLAAVNGEFTVKFLQKNDFKCRLISANKKYKDIEIKDGMTFEVWGVVTTVLTETKDVRHVCFD